MFSPKKGEFPCGKRNSLSDKIFFSRQSEEPVFCSRSYYNRAAFEIAAIGFYGFYLSVFYFRRLTGLKIGALFQNLLYKFFREFVSRKR